MFSSYPSNRTFARSFQLLRQAFLQAEGLPFSEVLSEDDMNRHSRRRTPVSPKTRATSILRQSRSGHSCRRRSTRSGCVPARRQCRAIVLCVTLGRQPPSPDTGAYCRAPRVARTRADAAGLWRGRSTGVAVPADWLWCGRHVKAGDGTTLMAPDTPENQKAWPQHRARSPAWASRSCGWSSSSPWLPPLRMEWPSGPTKGKGRASQLCCERKTGQVRYWK